MQVFRRGPLAFVLTLFIVAGCASKPEIVPSSGPRAAASADQVKIYREQPARYEELGVVEATAADGARWDAQGDATPGFDTLKRKAAERGANGLLLMVDEGMNDRFVTAGYNGTFFIVPVKGKPAVAMAQAIYVLKE